jgi:hypothetical protein
MPTLQIIVTSSPLGQPGLPVAQWFGDLAREHAGFDVQLVNLADSHLDGTTIEAADAFVFVVSDDATDAMLKIVTDSGDFEWQYKPAGFISHGGAGTKILHEIQEVVAPLGMTRIAESMVIDNVDDRSEAMEASANSMLDELWCLDPFLDALRAWAATTELAESA